MEIWRKIYMAEIVSWPEFGTLAISSNKMISIETHFRISSRILACIASSRSAKLTGLSVESNCTNSTLAFFFFCGNVSTSVGSGGWMRDGGDREQSSPLFSKMSPMVHAPVPPKPLSKLPTVNKFRLASDILETRPTIKGSWKMEINNFFLSLSTLSWGRPIK